MPWQQQLLTSLLPQKWLICTHTPQLFLHPHHQHPSLRRLTASKLPPQLLPAEPLHEIEGGGRLQPAAQDVFELARLLDRLGPEVVAGEALHCVGLGAECQDLAHQLPPLDAVVAPLVVHHQTVGEQGTFEVAVDGGPPRRLPAAQGGCEEPAEPVFVDGGNYHALGRSGKGGEIQPENEADGVEVGFDMPSGLEGRQVLTVVLEKGSWRKVLTVSAIAGLPISNHLFITCSNRVLSLHDSESCAYNVKTFPLPNLKLTE